MAEDPTKQDGGTEPTQAGGPDPSKAGVSQGEPQGEGAQEGEEGGVLDSHGQKGVALGKYKRDIQAKDDEIAELKRQLEAASAKAGEGDRALEEVNKLRQELKDKDLDASLAQLGCVDTKAARARLSDFGGDVEKLRDSCPYLFKASGTSGLRPAGSGNATAEQRRSKARAAAGLK